MDATPNFSLILFFHSASTSQKCVNQDSWKYSRIRDNWAIASNPSITSRLQDQGVDVIFLDLSKAFDLVPYHNLLQKLQSLGFGGSLLYWIRDYLTGRSFRLKVNGTLSDQMDVTSGVPQGSILGPLLFLLFMNDLSDGITSSCILYADDVKIWGPSGDPATLQHSLLSLENWVSENGTVLNTSKCKVLLIYTPALNHYYLGDELIPTSHQEKDLGSIISSDLSSSVNHREMAVRASGASNLIHRSIGKFQKTSFTRIYTSYVREYLELNIQACPPILSRDSLILERVQRRATKRVKGLSGKSYPERLKKLDLFSLAFRRLRGDMILTHKILMDLDHPNRSILTLRDDDCLRGHRLTLQQPKVRTKLRSNAFSARVPVSWNRLPADVVEATSTEAFKHGFDGYAFSKGGIVMKALFYNGKCSASDPWNSA